MGIKIEGVSFNIELCKEMPKDEFIKRHSVHFAERSERDRIRLLSDIYDRICPPAKSKRKADIGKAEDSE